jgi:hypothetical protein
MDLPVKISLYTLDSLLTIILSSLKPLRGFFFLGETDKQNKIGQKGSFQRQGIPGRPWHASCYSS